MLALASVASSRSERHHVWVSGHLFTAYLLAEHQQPLPYSSYLLNPVEICFADQYDILFLSLKQSKECLQMCSIKEYMAAGIKSAAAIIQNLQHLQQRCLPSSHSKILVTCSLIATVLDLLPPQFCGSWPLLKIMRT